MKCADCGAAIEEGSDICFECGSPAPPRAGASKAPAAPVGAYGAAAAAPPVKKSAFDDLIAEALQSVEEATPPSAPSPARASSTAIPAASNAPPRPRPRPRVTDDEPEKIRCPACGIPTTKTRCGSCGVILRHDD